MLPAHVVVAACAARARGERRRARARPGRPRPSAAALASALLAPVGLGAGRAPRGARARRRLVVGQHAARRARPQRPRAAHRNADRFVAVTTAEARARRVRPAPDGAHARRARRARAAARTRAASGRPPEPPRGRKAPRGPEHGFDERTWLRRQGVHVVLHVDEWHVVGRRGGLGGVADRLRRWLRRSSSPGLTGERRALVEGVLLGDDGGLSDGSKQAFRALGPLPPAGGLGPERRAARGRRARARGRARASAGCGATSVRSPRSARTCSRSGRSRR